MALRAFWRRGVGDGPSVGGRERADDRVRRAAGYVAEALEGRRLLSGMTPEQVAYSWNHMPAALRHELAVYEYVYPEFQVRLNAELADYGLEPVAPVAGTLGGDGRSRFHGQAKGHRVHRPHAGRGHQSKPVRHHGKDAGTGPSVTDFEYYDETKPNTVTFRFDQGIDPTNAGQALTVIDLNSGQAVSTTLPQYSPALHTLTYSFNAMDPDSPTPLISGDYAVFLDGSLITAEGNPNAKMLGTDKVAGDSYVGNFMFQVADANGDGNVSLSDFAVLTQDFGLSGATYSQGDFNYDGQVSLGDFSLLTKYFGGSVQPLAGPDTVTATAVDQSRIRLDWGASAEERVNGYDVYRDNVLIGSTPLTTYTDQPTGGTGERHGYLVVAKDPDGRASKAEAVVMAQTAPTVSGALVYQSLPQQLVFTFNQPVSAGWDSALVVIDLKTGSALAHGSGAYGATSPPTVTYDLSAPLADGNYAAILKGSQVTNADGTPLVGSDGVAGRDYVKDFYFLKGDLALDDRTVSQSDADTVSDHLGSAGGYSYGDVDYSGGVGQADVDFVTGAVGKTLPLLGAPGTPTVSSTSLNQNGTTASVSLAWGASGTSGVVYDVYRDYLTKLVVGTSQTTWTDLAVAPGSAHVYFVVARDASTQDTSYLSGELIATAAAVPPLAPTGFIPVEVTANSVLLAWSDDDPSVTGYNVYRSDLQHAESLVASNVAGTAYYEAGLTESTNYTYRVEAVTAAGASGVSSTHSVSTPAAGSLPAGYGVGRPSTPGGVTAIDTSSGTTNPPQNKIHVSWGASSGSGPIVYEIDRDGVAVGGTTSTTFEDNTVSAGVTYTYRVVAYDAAYNKSDASAPANGQAAGDVETPGAPLDLQVTGVTDTSVSLSWVKPGDDLGVTSYLFTRKDEANQLQFSVQAPDTSYTDHTVSAGKTYIYSIVAMDASGKATRVDDQHSATTITATTTAVGSSPFSIDSAPNQYIPPEWKDDFYDNLMAVLRQREAAVISSSVTVVASARYYDPGETIFQGTLPSGDQSQIHGTQGDYAFLDEDGNGLWTRGVDTAHDEPVWHDVNRDGVYEHDVDTVLHTGDGKLTDGAWGITTGITSAPSSGSILVWADSTTFAQDFTNFYRKLNEILPFYDSGVGSDFNPAADKLSVGAVLDGYSPTTTRTVFQNDNITIPQSSVGLTTSVIADTSGALNGELVDGDSVLIEDTWYPILSHTASQITLTMPYLGHGGTWPLTVSNWTLVPAASDPSTGITTQYRRGLPAVGNLIFIQQIGELHAALSRLNNLAPFYSYTYYGSRSTLFRSVARDVLNAYESVFGISSASNSDDQSLRVAIMGGEGSAGSIETVNPIMALRRLVVQLEGAVYVRNGAGWATDANGNPLTLRQDIPLLESLLPEIRNPLDTDFVMRTAGDWSSDSNGITIGPKSLIDNEHLTEIENVLNEMTIGPVDPVSRQKLTDQGLWVIQVDKAGVTIEGHILSSSSRGEDSESGYPPTVDVIYSDMPDPTKWDPSEGGPVITPNTSDGSSRNGISVTAGHLTSIRSVAAPATNGKAAISNAHFDLSSGKIVADLPSPHNSRGGADVQGVLAGPSTWSMDTSAWQWGTQVTVLTWEQDEVKGMLTGGDTWPPSPQTLHANQATRDPVSGYHTGGNPVSGLSYAWYYQVQGDANAQYYSDTYHDDVVAHYPAMPALYGLVPLGTTFVPPTDNGSGGSSSGSSGQPIPGKDGWRSVLSAPDASHPIPLTTEMDYRNVQPDVNLDGVLILQR